MLMELLSGYHRAVKSSPVLLLALIMGCQVSPDLGLGEDNPNRLICGDTSLTFQQVDGGLAIAVDGREYELEQVESASGSRYLGGDSGETELWTRGERARLTLEGRDLPECAYASGDVFSGPVWTVTEIGGEDVIVNYRATLDFAAAGHVGGRSSCNHYKASWQRLGDRVIVHNATTTRMACKSAVMEQERRFLDALGRVERFEVAPNGDLVLYGGGSEGRELIRARPRKGGGE